MTARLGVATLDKGMAIACEPRLDPNRHWGSECRLIRVRVSMLNIRQILQQVLLCGLLVLIACSSQAQAGAARIIIDTGAETLTVMRGSTVIRIFQDIAIGRYGKTYFKRQGDNKTPLGKYRIGWINRDSRYYIFLGLTYPDQPAADRALQDGRISTAQWQAIRRALKAGKTPLQDTPLGGYIGIHGLGEGDLTVHQRYNWTNGCVALTNAQLDQLLQWVQIGTSVEIR